MIRVPRDAVEALLRAGFTRRGLPETHVDLLVNGLVETSLRGIDTHGIRLFPVYLEELDGGRAAARPELIWTEPRPALHRLDAGGALGHVAAAAAADRAVELSERQGIGMAGVRNSNHFGAASVHTLRMARRAVIGLCWSNADALVAPAGGTQALFGTNPLSLAIVTDDGEELCVDMATSQSSYSRVRALRARGEPIPRGWAISADGSDLASSEQDLGALLPLGGHKGQCLIMMVSLLSAIVGGGPFDHELSHLYAPPFDEPRLVSHVFLSIALDAFGDRAATSRRLAAWLQTVRGVSPLPGVDRVVVPGDLERTEIAERERIGIPIEESDRRVLVEIAAADAPELLGAFGA